MKKQRKKVGLALGSGGIRGIAHVGVIKALHKHNIPIDYIAGSSIGAWVGAHYALFQDAERLEEFTVGKKQEKFRSFMELSLRGGGFIKGERMEALFDEWLEHKTFADVKIPFRCNAVDLISGDEVIFDSGSLAHAARVSMSIPGMFRPVHENAKVLVDGGVVNPVPDDIVRRMGADVVVAVNLDDFRADGRYREEDMGLANVANRTIEVMRHYLALYSMKNSDVIIVPPVAKYTNWREYFWNDAGRDIERIGAEAAEKVMPALKFILEN